jgi:hypothetical protein
MPVNSIDEVLAALTKLIDDCRASGDRIGYFASLYYKVTMRIKDGILKNEFEDGKRIEKLDVIFGNRYLDALGKWKSGGEPTESWKVALAATRDSSVLILQHLLLGMNAHINLDLGVASVEMMEGQPFESFQGDFDSVNAILGSLAYQVINDINHMSPLISLIGLHSGQTESMLVQFSMTNARDGAWCFAEDLSKRPLSERAAFIAERDRDIGKLADTLVHFKGTLGFTVWFIHVFEWKDIRKIIQELLEYKKTFIKLSKSIQ